MKKFMLFLLGLVVFVGAGVYYVKNIAYAKDPTDVSQISQSKLQNLTVKTEDLTTNLADGSYAKVSFNIVVNTKKGAEELTNKNFQINDYVINYLEGIDKDKFNSKEGTQVLIEKLQTYLDQQLTTGKILKIYLNSKLAE